jgi:mRNA-degrading endonuclease RelE of RelBE toxin-antitoxin system
MRYQVEFLPVALAQLRALPKDLRRLIGGKIDRLQDDLGGCQKAQGIQKQIPVARRQLPRPF